MALPADGQNANGLTKVTQIPAGKELMFIDPTTNEGGIITLEDLTKQILNGLASQAFALDAGQMTLLAALNKLNSDMVGKIHALSTDCGYLYFRKSADAVSVFGTLKVINQNNIDDHNIGEIPDFLNPNYDYVVLSAITNYIPYIPVGTLWIYRNGEIKLYHNAENTDLFVFGSYIIDRS